ncbi:MAG: hypothetical protein ACOY3H_02855 [Bacillota bacterium]|uniref:Uncharacterized protein n=2 Tax=Carboxydocella TaxID=178898 RepID=A0A1T4RFW0_9FIRM|nr:MULTISPECIES: hypothetical protein [Carboxydocella]AVX21720.1 hypothetical protein CFE_2577 [Carboxydocella thermautotrophica]AVX32131.1 hypothetical protein CTH_2592 [Carboxydocella thermautotrophica]SKA14551.1 hypothetical protein SAMN02745885_02085 [Carboxydocella sporoproducens DSM 16521]GAW27634.1 hypothetical protein ULO1_02040 [Carboxydocella sp. ULO1]GAW31829.1 hypothetical protein JDF658_15940 [Carboxydocella sp. JDF658]
MNKERWLALVIVLVAIIGSIAYLEDWFSIGGQKPVEKQKLTAFQVTSNPLQTYERWYKEKRPMVIKFHANW